MRTPLLSAALWCGACQAADTGATDAATLSYPVVDTRQGVCWDDAARTDCPALDAPFAGQDAQHEGLQPSYIDNGDGTVTDQVTILTWTQSPDLDEDGDIDAADKRTEADARAWCDALDVGGKQDWRLPTIKELYSLMDFRGTDPSGATGNDTSALTPFLDTTFFDFGYGDLAAGERLIDAQYATTTRYVDTVMLGDPALFGVNFADGRIKGYDLVYTMSGPGDATFYVRCARGEPYGVNDLVDDGDGTVRDQATGLQWSQEDSGVGMDWEAALAWVGARNAEGWLGQDDWRLPNAKELQSLVDYTRSPATTASAAIDLVFSTTGLTNEVGDADFPFYWTSTTHISSDARAEGAAAVYVAFGRAMGDMTAPWDPSQSAWLDVHGAGAQRSDPKQGDPAEFPNGRGPQGDAIRILNFVRLVRDADPTSGG